MLLKILYPKTSFILETPYWKGVIISLKLVSAIFYYFFIFFHQMIALVMIFQNFLFSKEFPACNGCFGLFSKIKKGSGANFWCTISAWFFHKNILYLIHYQWREFQCHTLFLSQDMKLNMLLSSYLDSWWHHKL